MAEPRHRNRPDPLHPTVVEIVDAQVAHQSRKLTPLGRQLLEARRLIEQAGIPLLNLEEIGRERSARHAEDAPSLI